MAKKKKYKFEVTLVASVTVEFNDDIVPDDDWREYMYGDIKTPKDLAMFLGYNCIANGTDKLSQLDGFADKKDSQCVYSAVQWYDCEAELK